MSDMPIGGVAVWAHTGRGLLLTEEERAEVLTHWRESLPDRIIIAGAGSREMAEHAKALGADAILCHPQTHSWQAGRSMSGHATAPSDEEIIEYHNELSSAGLPLILFYLYEAAGGIDYSLQLLRKLFALPNVIGIKIATLDSVMTFQTLASFIKSEFLNKLLITGEDRFLGYSLMMGADAALVGMGAALTALQAEMMHAFYAQNFDRFLYQSKFVDRFAMATFTDPMEGYISRVLYALSWLGVVSPEAIYDPWCPELPEEEIEKVGDFLTMLPTELKL
ncbi:MAG: dihydrodipicolinate synthase family protein, partial [Candidatus Kapaibacterium sp.]